MKHYTIGVLALAVSALVMSGCAGAQDVKLTPSNIDKVLKAMTLEEKAHLLVGGGQKEEVDSTVQVMIAACRDMVPGCAGFTYPIPRLGIPSIILADGPAGLRIAPTREGTDSTFNCTGFPIGSLLSSTWDVNLVEEMCSAMGDEVREYGVDVLLAPGQNLHRNPLCGRNFEYFSEDPLLSGRISAAYVRGVQKAGVGTSVKHFAVNNSEVNRLSCDSRVSVRACRELYLKNFEVTMAESSPWTVMTSYNYLNGRYTSEDVGLLSGILRTDWGFKGVVMSDWGGGYDAAQQVLAGNDLNCPGNDAQYRAIVAGVQSGRLPISAVDACVRRMLELIVKTPTFAGYKNSNAPDLAVHAAVARKAAAEGMVLLRNEDSALPLAAGSTVAMFGANSYKLVAGGTGAGDVNKAYTVSLDKAVSESNLVLDPGTSAAYSAYLVGEKARVDAINASRGWWFGDVPYAEMPAAAIAPVVSSAARSASVAVITITRQAGEGRDRLAGKDFGLSADESALISAVSDTFHAVGKKVVVVLNVGGVVETASWKDSVDAILLAWQPGQEAGYAICDILCGDVNPSGRLPMTFPVSYESVPAQNFPQVVLPELKNGSYWHHKAGRRYYEQKNVDWLDYTEDVYVGYRYYETFGKEVSYPFGYGLSYTTFDFEKVRVEEVRARKGKPASFKVTVLVCNTGSVPGRQVVQLYSMPQAGANAPSCELRAFAKTGVIAPGASEEVVLTVSAADLAIFDEAQSAWVTAAGPYVLGVGADAAHITHRCPIMVEKEIVRPVTRAIEPVRMTSASGNQTNIVFGESKDAGAGRCYDSVRFEPSPVFVDTTSVKLAR